MSKERLRNDYYGMIMYKKNTDTTLNKMYPSPPSPTHDSGQVALTQKLRNSETQILRNSGTRELRHSGTQELRN